MYYYKFSFLWFEASDTSDTLVYLTCGKYRCVLGKNSHSSSFERENKTFCPIALHCKVQGCQYIWPYRYMHEIRVFMAQTRWLIIRTQFPKPLPLHLRPYREKRQLKYYLEFFAKWHHHSNHLYVTHDCIQPRTPAKSTSWCRETHLASDTVHCGFYRPCCFSRVQQTRESNSHSLSRQWSLLRGHDTH